MNLRKWISSVTVAILLLIPGQIVPPAFGEDSPIVVPFSERDLAEADENTPTAVGNPPTLASADAATNWLVDRDLALEQQLNALRQEFGAFKEGLAKPKYPSVEIHGVFQVDSGWFNQSANNIATLKNGNNPTGNIQDGADFRRARLSANGAVAPNMNYFLQMDFAFPGRPTFTDVWFEVTKVPVLGNVRVGQWKQPFSLEVVSSFRYTTFAERSLLFNSFDPFRHIGIGFYDYAENERMTWAASVYRPGQDQFGGSIADNGGYAGVGRITALPWWDEDAKGGRYLHVGAGYNYVAPTGQSAQFRTIPEYFIGSNGPGATLGTAGVASPGNINGTPFFVDTSKISIDHYNLVGSELLWVNGAFSLQSEAQWLMGTKTNGQRLYLPGMYAQAGYFLTGEHRPYNRKQGAIDRIQVLRPLGRAHTEDCDWGWGGWEVAGRYSYLDLNSHGVAGGRLSDMTLGLNWYLNNYSKVQFNYIRTFLDNPTHGKSTADIFGLRAQVDF